MSADSGDMDSIHVLHVDDNADFAELVATFLEQTDDHIEVQTAASVDDAESLLSDDAFDCIVSDYDLPGRNGIEFLERVREEWPDLPFILYTGKGSEEVASDATSAGVTDYIQKETGTDQYTVLANRVTNAVEHYHSQQILSDRNRDLRRYKQMVNSMQEAACIYDAEGRFEVVNDYLAEWYGTTREELEGTASTLISRVRDEQESDPYRELLNGERSILRGEIESEFPGHGPAIVEYQLTRLAPDGAVEGVVGVARDITDRREREKELERYEAYLEESTDIITVVDADGTITYESPATARVLGYEPGALVGENGFDLIHPDDRDAVVEAFSDLVAEPGGTATVECRFRTASDDWRWLETNGKNQLDREPINGIVTNNRDITERKRYEQRLEALNRATRELITAETRTAVAELGVDVAEETLGLEVNAIHLYDEEQSGLVPAAATDAVHKLVGEPPTFAGDGSIAWRAYTTGESFSIDDVREHPDCYDPETAIRSELYLPLGEYGVLLAGSTSTATFSRQDIVLGEILAGNITSALEQVERAEKLRARSEELSRQKERFEEFSSVVSHDLRNPLNVANLQLQLAREDCQSDHLDSVDRAHNRMEELIEDLLDLARHGETPADTEPIDLADLVECCWQNVKTSDGTLVVDLDGTVRAGESRLRQLFENLIRNSIEHSDQPVTVTIGTLANGFYVADDGPGIPAGEREKVFKTGYTTATDGSGFGLSIVKQVAEAHGWDIRVDASQDGGARFEITGVEFAAE